MLFDYFLTFVEKVATPKDINIKEAMDKLCTFAINQSTSPLMLSSKIYANMTHIEEVNQYFSYFFSLESSSDNVSKVLKHIIREISQLMEQESEVSALNSHSSRNSGDFILALSETSPKNIFEFLPKLFSKLEFCDVFFDICFVSQFIAYL